METKHTPGPWRAGKSGVIHADSRIVADVASSSANATLVAAAPDMLAALKAIPDVHDAATCGDPGGFSPERCTCWVRQARAAIAKAEG